MLRFERLALDEVPWDRLDAFPDRNVYQTREWIEFVAEAQRAEPVIAALSDGSQTVGFFTGLIVGRYGVRILGSPFRGWTTAYLGFNLEPGVPRREAAAALARFAFGPLRCLHLELRDRRLTADEVDGLRFAYSPKTVFEIDLGSPEDEIFSRMTSACRRCVRKAAKVGVSIEEAADLEFADDYFAQLRDVYAKQSLVPSYNREHVRLLIRHVHPTGRLLLLRARSADGTCIATGIFPAMNGAMYFWGGASWREHQILRPNEALMWHALKYWKARAVSSCDLGGGADYKRKYGGVEVAVPYFRISRFRGVAGARHMAKQGFRLRQKALGRLATSLKRT